MKSTKQHSAGLRNRALTFESLEQRQLLAADVEVSNGRMILTGDDSANHFVLNRVTVNGVTSVRVQVDNQPAETFSADSFDRIFGAMGAGNDKVDASGLGLAKPMELQGGAGNDTLQGGPGNDILDGQEGNDGLLGGNGADLLLGRSGRDNLWGQRGNDRLNGGAHTDQLVDTEGRNNIYAVDQVFDFIHAGANTAVQRDTNVGTDFFRADDTTGVTKIYSRHKLELRRMPSESGVLFQWRRLDANGNATGTWSETRRANGTLFLGGHNPGDVTIPADLMNALAAERIRVRIGYSG